MRTWECIRTTCPDSIADLARIAVVEQTVHFIVEQFQYRFANLLEGHLRFIVFLEKSSGQVFIGGTEAT